MKNIFCLLLCILSLGAYSQKAVIVCDGLLTEDCFRPNPNVFVGYKGQVDNSLVIGSPWTIVSATWSARPLNQLVNPNTESDKVQTNAGIPTFYTTWLNNDNTVNSTTNQKKVTLSMVVTRRETIMGVEQDVTKTINESKIINVKFLGAIASASSPSINGGASFTSGQTVGLPCNTQPFTVTVPTPANGTGQVNDPAVTINYTWSLPSGWSGSSTTNSITITPAATGDATIFVDAKRSDGTIIKSFSFKVSRASFQVGDPTINLAWGGPIICAGNTRFATGVAANATSFVWSPVSTATLYSPNTNVNYAYVQFNSTTTLTLTVDNGCGLPKTVSKVINVGAPIFSEATVNGAPQQTTYKIPLF